jgi:hypothetical protein
MYIHMRKETAMKKSKVAFGTMMLVLIGFAAGSAHAQWQQQQECETCPPPGPDGECSQPAGPPPVCKQPECPQGGCFPEIQTGECWSQCIYPGQFKTVCKKVETGNGCPVPRVEQDGTKMVPVNKTVREKCYGLRRGVDCRDKRVGWTYELVRPETTDVITYRTCKEQEVPAGYAPATKDMKVPYEEPYGKPGQVSPKKMKVQVKSEWERLYRKKSSCWDCTDVCRETEGPEYDWITGYTCQGKDQQCSFGYKKQYQTCTYQMEQCVPPQLPPADQACVTKEITVTVPAEYKKVPVIVEVCSPGKVRKMPVEAVVEPVDCPVPAFRELCDAPEPTSQCVSEQVQVCSPFLEWRREQFCNYDDKGPFIKKVQIALQQEGFDPGPLDGMMGDQTRQAIRAFQQAEGLAQGGTLTKETVQALGIQE